MRQRLHRRQQMRNFRHIVQKGVTLGRGCLQRFGKRPEDKETRKKNEARNAAHDGERPGSTRDMTSAAIFRIEKNRMLAHVSFTSASRAPPPVQHRSGPGSTVTLGVKAGQSMSTSAHEYATSDERKLYKRHRIYRAFIEPILALLCGADVTVLERYWPSR